MWLCEISGDLTCCQEVKLQQTNSNKIFTKLHQRRPYKLPFHCELCNVANWSLSTWLFIQCVSCQLFRVVDVHFLCVCPVLRSVYNFGLSVRRCSTLILLNQPHTKSNKKLSSNSTVIYKNKNKTKATSSKSTYYAPIYRTSNYTERGLWDKARTGAWPPNWLRCPTVAGSPSHSDRCLQYISNI